MSPTCAQMEWLARQRGVAEADPTERAILLDGRN